MSKSNPKKSANAPTPIRILYVEDTPADAELCLHDIKKAGFEPHADIVSTPGEFKQNLRSKPYDVILSDCSLPQFSAMEALEIVKKEAPDIPFILVTGTLGDEGAVEAIKQGATDYVLKDRRARLAPSVRRALEEKQLRQERKQAEEALAASEVRYRRLFETAKDGLLILDAETGMIVDVNPFLIKLLGSRHEHFLRKHIWDLGFFKDIVANKATFEELQRKDHIRYESLPLKTADGRPTDVEFVSNSYQVDGKKVIQCNVRDITQRKRAEEQLRRLNRALQTISECNQVIVRATDELDLNNQICRILVEHGGYRMAWVGYAEQDETKNVRPVAHAGHDEGYLAEARITWADTERGRGPTGKAVRSGTVCVVRQTSTEPDYEPWRVAAMHHGFAALMGLPLVASSHILGALTLYTGEVDAFDDAEVKLLTELANDLAYGIQALRTRAAHAQAEESLIRLRKAVEASGEVIFMTDRDGIINFINPEFTRVYGYTEAEVVGKATPRILKSGNLQPGDYANFWKTILEKRVARGEIVNKTKNGRLVSVHSSVNPVLDEAGHIAGFLAIQRDLSARKQMEQQFRQAQKMEALGQLAGGVSHDFNNLLTVISGYSELLAEGLGQDGPRLEQVKQIQNAAVRAASLTRQLLAFSRRQTMVMEVMDINSAVARAEKMLDRVIGENIELITRPARKLGHVKADPGQVEQVIINLAINARDAMPGGGKLIIATANVEISADDSRCRSGLNPGAYISLTVADTGSGIDPKIKANIFEPFFTTKERGKGTGLGLATVYGIVQQSGGFVNVETELGSGSTFQVLLPRVEQTLALTAMEPAAKNHRPCTETVLVVEDEPPLRTLVRGILESCGYRVLEAGDGGEALAICERHEGPIDLVLTDVVMPQMGGPELALRLASRWPKIRIIYMSGYAGAASADVAEREANHDFIAKPFTPKALTSKVREALDAK